MTGFSATDAALEGFRITRERPRALLAWTGFCFAVNVANVLITVNLPKEARDALEWLERPGEAPDGQALMSALTLLSPLLAFGLATQCVMAAAVYRILLRPDDSKFSYLRLGRDELRLMALTLIYVVLAVVAFATAQFVIVIVASLAGAFGEAAFSFVFSILELVVLAGFFYASVRLSLAPVITFYKGRLAITDSWPVTRGHFWRLLGSYVLAISCVVVVSLLAMMIFSLLASIATLSTGGSLSDLSTIFRDDETQLASYLNPLMIAYMIVGGLFTAIAYAVVAAPGAWAYRELTGQGGQGDAPAAAI